VVLRTEGKPHKLSSSFGSIIFVTYFYKALGIYFYSEAKVTELPLFDACTPVCFFVCGDDYPSLTIVRCTPKTPGHLPHTIKLKNSVAICSLNAIYF